MKLKKILAAALALAMLLALAACGGKQPDPDPTDEPDTPAVTETPQPDPVEPDPTEAPDEPDTTVTPDPTEEPEPVKPDPTEEPEPVKPDPTEAPKPAQEKTAQEVLDALKAALGASYTSDAAETEARMSGYWGLDLSRIESWASEGNSNSALNSDCAIVLKVKDGYADTAAALLQTGFEQILSYNRMYDMDLQRVLQARLFVNGNYVALLIEGAQGDWEASAEEQAKFAAEEAGKVDSAWSAIFGSAGNIITVPEDDGSSNFFDMSEDDALLGG